MAPLKYDDTNLIPHYYINYEYLLWKNKPQEEAATPILGYHRNAIKPIKSFKEMLLEKCANENTSDGLGTFTDQIANGMGAMSLNMYTQQPPPTQPKKFDINALISPLMAPYPLYSRTKGFHSNPQSPLMPPPLKPEGKMSIYEPSSLQANNMKLHPGYTQFKKEIFESNPTEFSHNQFPEYFPPKPEIPTQPVEFRPSAFTQVPTAASQNSHERFFGRLKFFDEFQGYGFFIMDIDSSDLFVHYEDLKKAGLTKEFLKVIKGNACFRFSFNCVSYYGKYSLSRKAINIEYFYDAEAKHEYGYMQ